MRQFLCLVMFALLTATPALPAQKDFNGRWAIHATTDRGQCWRGFRLTVRIFRGKAYLIGYSLNGAKTAIGSRGQVNIRYARGADVITINGMLKRRTGAGSWHFPTYRCAGRWRASKL